MTWDVPVADNCPECGQTLFKLSGRGAKKPFCTNVICKKFLPEDKRGYRRNTKEGGAKKTSAKKPAAKKSAIKKPAAKKTTQKKTPTKKTSGAAK